MLTDNANVWPIGAPFDWNANPRRVRCRGCGRGFELEVVVYVKYTSSRRSEDMPDDYMYMSLEERFAYAEKLAEVVE